MYEGAQQLTMRAIFSNSVQSYTKKSEIIAFFCFFYDIYSPLTM